MHNSSRVTIGTSSGLSEFVRLDALCIIVVVIIVTIFIILLVITIYHDDVLLPVWMVYHLIFAIKDAPPHDTTVTTSRQTTDHTGLTASVDAGDVFDRSRERRNIDRILWPFRVRMGRIRCSNMA